MFRWLVGGRCALLGARRCVVLLAVDAGQSLARGTVAKARRRKCFASRGVVPAMAAVERAATVAATVAVVVVVAAAAAVTTLASMKDRKF